LVGVEVEQADGAVNFAAGFGDDFALFFDEQCGGLVARSWRELAGF
jgi:hypothetical protein